jgi:hypothetical protein
VRSFYPRRKENLDLFLFIFDGRGKRCGFIGENAQKFLRAESLAKLKIEFLRVENRFLAGFLSVP